MGRYSKQKAYAQRIQPIAFDFYRLHWVVDFYVAGSRLRHPRSFSRDTDTAGAVRFAKRWDLEFTPPTT